MYLVELKTDSGYLSQMQMHWHSRAAELGIYVAVLHGRNECLAWLRARIQEIEPHQDDHPERR